MEQKIKAIMAKVFKVNIHDINVDTSQENVPQWTSVEHVEFVLNLEQEFDIEFTDSQLVEGLLSYKAAVETVKAAMEAKNV